MSEAFGQTRPLSVGMIAFYIFQIPVAITQNLETILIYHFLAVKFGSAPLAIIGGIYIDLIEPIDRYVATLVFAGDVFVGTVAGRSSCSLLSYL